MSFPVTGSGVTNGPPVQQLYPPSAAGCLNQLDIPFEKHLQKSLSVQHSISKHRLDTTKRRRFQLADQGISSLFSPSDFFAQHPLIAATLSPKTRKSYVLAFSSFVNALRAYPSNGYKLDIMLSSNIEDEFQDDPAPGNRQRITNTMCYINIVCPHLKPHFGLSRRALAGWNKLTPPQTALPLTASITRAFAQFFSERGLHITGEALFLQWTTYMRGSEVLALQRTDIALPGDPRLHHTGSSFRGINIEVSKTGSSKFTPIRNSEVITFIQTYVQRVTTNHSERIFSLSYRKYNDLLREAATFFGLPANRFTSHSTRIGGAVSDYCRGISAQTIALTGRWRSFSSLERYLKAERAWIISISMQSYSQERISRASQKFSHLLQERNAYLSQDRPARTTLA